MLLSRLLRLLLLLRLWTRLGLLLHPLRLLLRPLHLRPLLENSLALRLLSADAICALLLNLLSTQILHLLPRVSIPARCLSRQISNLSLSGLLRRKVLLLACPRRAFALRCWCGRSAFISELNLLIPDAVRERLDSQRLSQISSRLWRRRPCAG